MIKLDIQKSISYISQEKYLVFEDAQDVDVVPPKYFVLLEHALEHVLLAEQSEVLGDAAVGLNVLESLKAFPHLASNVAANFVFSVHEPELQYSVLPMQESAQCREDEREVEEPDFLL